MNQEERRDEPVNRTVPPTEPERRVPPTEPERRDEPVNRTPMRAEHHEEHHGDGGMWAGMGDYRRRFDELQSQFIEEPEETVRKAEKLVEEAVEKMVDSLHQRVNHIHSGMGDGHDKDTEQLRLAMREYRRLFDSMGSGRAA